MRMDCGWLGGSVTLRGRVEDHRFGGTFARRGERDHFQRTVGQHPLEFDRDAVRRDVIADVVEDDFGTAAPVEDNPGRRDEQIADACGQRRRANRQWSDKAGEDEAETSGHVKSSRLEGHVWSKMVTLTLTTGG